MYLRLLVMFYLYFSDTGFPPFSYLLDHIYSFTFNNIIFVSKYSQFYYIENINFPKIGEWLT